MEQAPVSGIALGSEKPLQQEARAILGFFFGGLGGAALDQGEETCGEKGPALCQSPGGEAKKGQGGRGTVQRPHFGRGDRRDVDADHLPGVRWKHAAGRAAFAGIAGCAGANGEQRRQPFASGLDRPATRQAAVIVAVWSLPAATSAGVSASAALSSSAANSVFTGACAGLAGCRWFSSASASCRTTNGRSSSGRGFRSYSSATSNGAARSASLADDARREDRP